jgi:AGZA family xanthine/uracil permease-like MFS transporter
MGTLVGVGKQAGYLDKNGELPDVRTPLLVDSLSAIAGGAASSSSATTYIESGFGFRVAQGRWRDVHPFMYASAGAFALYFLVPLLQDHLSWI